MKDIIALLDMDGTVADFDTAMQKAMAELASPDEPPFASFMGARRPDWMEARKHLISSMPGFWRNLPKLQAGFDVVEVLRKEGYTINVLTKGPSRRPGAWTEKVEWCKLHLPDIAITITENKSIAYGRVLVDDWPAYYTGWLAYRPRGIVIVPAQLWNEGAEVAFPNNIFRYDRTQEGAREKLEAVLHAVSLRRDGEDVNLRSVLGR